VAIFVPKTGLDFLEEKAKTPYDPNLTDRCLKTLKITERKIVALSPKTAFFQPPRKSTLFEIARKAMKQRPSDENTMSLSQKELKRWSLTSMDPAFKSVLKRIIYENVKFEDLDCPWKYFTEGTFHYNIGNLLKDGDFFGELGLLTKKPRRATVLCLEETFLMYLEKTDYKNVVQSVDYGKITKKIEFFERFFLRGFTQDSILKLSYFFLKRKYGLNEVIYEENEKANGCYLIKKGEIAVFIRLL